MGKTFAEKILAMKSGKKEVVTGETVTVSPDIVLSHDNTAAIMERFNQMGAKKVLFPEKVVIILDHCIPAASKKYASNHKVIRSFVQKQQIKYFYDINTGICHQVLPEKEHILPGTIVLGADSHTTTHGALGAFASGIGRAEVAAIWAIDQIWLRVPHTVRININGNIPKGIYAKDIILYIIGNLRADGVLYQAVEYKGDVISRMSISGRMTLCNMAVEMEAKIGYVEPDKKTNQWLSLRGIRNYNVVKSDLDAMYERVINYDISEIMPQITCPHTVDNIKSVNDLEKIPINQALIGSCTNGRLEDLQIASDILKGKKFSKQVRLLIFPASMEIYRKAIKSGIIEELVKSGAVIMNPGCGCCIGIHEGVLAPGEVCLSTTNRNFIGRMGSAEAEIYLASPATVATSALYGEIVDVRRLLN